MVMPFHGRIDGGIATGKKDDRDRRAYLPEARSTSIEVIQCPIPREIALKLCAEIREVNLKKRFNFLAMQCRGCWKFSKGDPDKMCVTANPGYRGCYLVNRRYDRNLIK